MTIKIHQLCFINERDEPPEANAIAVLTDDT